MKKLLSLFVCGLAVAVASPVSADLIDDFEDGNLDEYTSTVILDAGGVGSNTADWQIVGGELQLNTSVYDGIEQYAFIYDGLSLLVGEEVQVDISHTGDSQDIGLYVGGTAPTTGVRQDYVAVYARANGQVFSRGFDGTSEYALTGGGSDPYTRLFIARTDTNTYEAGFYDGTARSIITTRTPTTANAGTFVGFYADVRGTGAVGNADNLRIVPVPEPASAAVIGLAGLAALCIRRRK